MKNRVGFCRVDFVIRYSALDVFRPGGLLPKRFLSCGFIQASMKRKKNIVKEI